MRFVVAFRKWKLAVQGPRLIRRQLKVTELDPVRAKVQMYESIARVRPIHRCLCPHCRHVFSRQPTFETVEGGAGGGVAVIPNSADQHALFKKGHDTAEKFAVTGGRY